MNDTRRLSFAYIMVMLLCCSLKGFAYGEVRSGQTFLQGRNYQVVEDGQTPGRFLLLGKSVIDDSTVQWVVDGAFPILEGRVTKEANLAVWNGVDLIAVVTVQDKSGQRKAFLLWFRGADLTDVDKGYIKATIRLLHSEESNFRILALNGSFQGDGILVVLGTVLQEEFERKVKTVTVILDESPIPGTNGDSKSSFK